MALRFLPNLDLIVTILALAKAGLAYVPIAPNWPAGRVRLILQQAQPAFFITNTRADLIYKAMADMDNDSIISVQQVCRERFFWQKSKHFQKIMNFLPVLSVLPVLPVHNGQIM